MDRVITEHDLKKAFDDGYRTGVEARKPEWISVDERLPEIAGLYLVAYHPCHWNCVNTNRTEVGIDTFRGKTTWARQKFQRVTHWQPLPQLPKKE